mmetsp:Transcript_32200/g.49926  ORF Transcript_32200/g.49926 Transcript_32200/m.49926 type:complete len:350 (+) Transcript_32200:81-1130(+)|eukprot:CAMPEP_0117048896 /NCGR_PEP_ID=MMETSP0472-20121206/33805_1 /TAXON_ID=693140 ORGANISM="Tiarina fusus, Strain LIS" /NCGR_SAMPLE_ID=MMETSP0472 /ASSEMBLY_ACC=CAM_ASM_000603 /LENGTH=349 /DNA_ID=CAMNT_0004762181 /DNA_START=81 /DNA_END=1130 /DNA_ORIENTATION=-
MAASIGVCNVPSTTTTTTTNPFASSNERILSEELQLSATTPASTKKKVQEEEEESKEELPLPKIIGHRGSLYDAVENTIESFQRCYEAGSAGIELDVFLLPKDGSLIVFHGSGTDASPGQLWEYCQVKGLITDLTWDEVQELSFVSSDQIPIDSRKLRQMEEEQKEQEPQQTNENNNIKVPTLEQVLTHFQGKRDPQGNLFQIKIELKGPGTVLPSLELVERYHMQKQCTFSSFYHDRLKQLRDLRPNKELVRTGATFKGTLPQNFIQHAQALGVNEIHLRYDTCTTRRVREVHKAGFESMAWFRGPKAMKQDLPTFRDVESELHLYELVARTGVQQLCVNRPALAMAL